MRITGLPLRYVSCVRGGIAHKLGIRSVASAAKYAFSRFIYFAFFFLTEMTVVLFLLVNLFSVWSIVENFQNPLF